MTDEVAKRDTRLLPPVYFLLAIGLMVALRFYLPVRRWLQWPWNLAGAVPILIGVAMTAIADAQFKRRGTTIRPFRPSSALVTDGVFRFSRNPMYLGMVFILIGLGIGLASLTPLAVIPIFAWWMNVRFIAPEEQSLMEQFGQAYVEYTIAVRRWL